MQMLEPQQLLDKYLDGKMTPEEISRFKQLLHMDENQETWQRLIETVLKEKRYDDVADIDSKELFDNLLVSIAQQSATRRVHFLHRKFFRYAAAIILTVGIAGAAYFLTTGKRSEQEVAKVNQPLKINVPPGGNKATLTLADGSTIILDSVANGNIANQGGVQVIKLANGQITYDLSGAVTKEVMWNTVSTPRGGQYQIVLPDGSKVWLNAASSITYPTAFTAKERKIKIDGEAYFEVSKNKQKPFLVDVRGESLIQVLGTSFNINSYRDEKVIRTTLVKGSVKISKGKESVILQPGQQAVAATSNEQFKIADVNVDQVIAWKNGFFNLENLDTYAVMRQLERWYDIKVQYEGTIHNVIFQGEIVRDTNLSDVIELLQGMGVKCRMEGKTLVVN